MGPLSLDLAAANMSLVSLATPKHHFLLPVLAMCVKSVSHDMYGIRFIAEAPGEKDKVQERETEEGDTVAGWVLYSLAHTGRGRPLTRQQQRRPPMLASSPFQ